MCCPFLIDCVSSVSPSDHLKDIKELLGAAHKWPWLITLVTQVILVTLVSLDTSVTLFWLPNQFYQIHHHFGIRELWKIMMLLLKIPASAHRHCVSGDEWRERCSAFAAQRKWRKDFREKTRERNRRTSKYNKSKRKIKKAPNEYTWQKCRNLQKKIQAEKIKPVLYSIYSGQENNTHKLVSELALDN